MLISDETIEKINLIIQKCFDLNRTYDRFIGFAGVEWAFDNFNKTFHNTVVHAYPILADKFADILLRYNIAPKYYETHSDVRTYEGMIEAFNTILNEHTELYNLIREAINVSTINGDLNVEADLKGLLRIFNRFMEQTILLRDKAEVYGENNKAMFDGFANQFYVIEDVIDELNG